MRLATFILANLEAILVEWEAFAATLLPAAAHMDSAGLRDHAKAMLEAIAEDLQHEQSAEAQMLKSRGQTPKAEGSAPTAAQQHATLRARDGFNIEQMTAEYRALRATVLRLWVPQGLATAQEMQDLIRFNEAIDQALAESMRDFSQAVDKGRNLLLGMLGHDMRNPLNVIVATASYLTRLNVGDEVSVAAARLINSGARIQALVTDLVDFSRSQLGAGINVVPATVDLVQICRTELDMHRAAHPDRLITLVLDGELTGCWDGNRIHQVLGNLVSNALKYGAADTPVVVRLTGDATTVHITVENKGPAIPADLLACMFEPMKRGNRLADEPAPTDGGLGLGLYIAREIVLAHKGRISVRSDASGTLFVVELPR